MVESDGFGFGGGLGGLGIIAILIIAMMFMGGRLGPNQGGGGATDAVLAAMAANNNGGYKPQYATQDFVQNGFNFNDLQNQNRDIMGAVTGGTAQSVAASNQVYHDLDRSIQNAYSELQRDVAGIAVSQAQALANQNQCCCETKMVLADGFAQTNANIAQNRYENAMNTAAIQKTIIEEAQKNRDLYTGNRMADMQNQINQLQMNQALAGVVRYQPNITYGSVPSPIYGGPIGYPA
ncbi:MAG: hypothetical protein IKP60_07260 [Treponema sp.]|nr:hypothetical protein [Treponema sp.]